MIAPDSKSEADRARVVQGLREAARRGASPAVYFALQQGAERLERGTPADNAAGLWWLDQALARTRSKRTAEAATRALEWLGEQRRAKP